MNGWMVSSNIRSFVCPYWILSLQYLQFSGSRGEGPIFITRCIANIFEVEQVVLCFRSDVLRRLTDYRFRKREPSINFSAFSARWLNNNIFGLSAMWTCCIFLSFFLNISFDFPRPQGAGALATTTHNPKGGNKMKINNYSKMCMIDWLCLTKIIQLYKYYYSTCILRVNIVYQYYI